MKTCKNVDCSRPAVYRVATNAEKFRYATASMRHGLHASERANQIQEARRTRIRDLSSVTRDQLIEAVRSMAARHPNMTYTVADPQAGCRYAPDEVNPLGCVMHAALASLGVVYDEEWEGQSIGHLLNSDSMTPEEKWLRDVQCQQDRGNVPWSDADEVSA